MGLSASQGRMLLLTARKDDLEFRAQQISQRRLILSQQLEEVATEYEDATSNRQMKINLFQVGPDADGTKISKTVNLTYAALVSGTLAQASSEQSGIQAYSRTEDQEYQSNAAYRLIDAHGAIVVSSEEEIPGSYKEPQSKTISRTDEKGKVTDLSKFLNDKNDSGNKEYKEIESLTYGKDGAIQIKYKNQNDEEKVVYFTNNGKEKSSSDYSEENPFLEADGGKVEIVSAEKEATLKIKWNDIKFIDDKHVTKGADGIISVYDNNGVVINKYVVDGALKYGSTDSNGDKTGPNYLQDCLRNGKYLIEKGGVDADEGVWKWKSLSWDSTSNINDNYYTEDDDKAKAKYDRKQNQIQAQDKKLELELDNIETQRSAVTTEIDSVQKVIDDNVQSSFKIFNA